MFVFCQTLRGMLIFLLLSCAIRAKGQEDVWMTVFVHGIMSIQAHLSIGLVFKLLCDNVAGSMYADTIRQMRDDNFFQHNQLMQQVGLHPVLRVGKEAKTAPEVLATLYDIALHSTGMREKNLYYTFGWSGLLSNCERKKAADGFYKSLFSEIKRLKKQGMHPKIRLIGYSHGANVCLQLAESKYKFPDKQFSVDEFILIGCPIHDNSNPLVADPLFKSVYNLYSKRDQIQTLDCFSAPDLFSKRRFFNKKDVVIPPKVTQAAIRVTHAIGRQKHFHTTHFLFSKKLQRLRSHYYLKDESAGHVELWFLGWTPRHYREQFALYPYPILVFVPCIIHALKRSGLQHNDVQYQLMVDLRPDFDEIIVTSGKKQYKQPFPYQTLAAQFSPIADRAEPKEYTKGSSGEFIAMNKKKAIKKREHEGIVSTKKRRLRNFLSIH